jgi:hypothetical protein
VSVPNALIKPRPIESFHGERRHQTTTLVTTKEIKIVIRKPWRQVLGVSLLFPSVRPCRHQRPTADAAIGSETDKLETDNFYVPEFLFRITTDQVEERKHRRLSLASRGQWGRRDTLASAQSPFSRTPGSVVFRTEKTPPSASPIVNLSGGHGLGHKTLEGKLLLLEVLGGAVGELESGHGVADGALDLLLLGTLDLEGQGGVGDNLLNTANVRLELLLGLEALAEGLVAGACSHDQHEKLVLQQQKHPFLH